MIGVTMESVRYWWNRIAFTLDYVRGPHGVVVADETKILVEKREDGEAWTLWVAIRREDHAGREREVRKASAES